MNSYDSEPIAFAEVGQFACLEVVSVQSIGAFLDLGIAKDLFLPFREQTRSLREGDYVVVYLYVDNTQRLCASMRTNKYIDTAPGDYEVGQPVDLLIAGETDLGYRAIIEDRHYGMLYANEVFRRLRYGDRVRGFIKAVRPDGKIDLSLERSGYRAAGDIGAQILEKLDDHGGFLSLHDGSPAEEIYDALGISKKKFKMAVGALYKKGAIELEPNGIRKVHA